MIIIGYEPIAWEKFSKVLHIDDLETTQGLVWFEANQSSLEIAKKCQDSHIPFAVCLDTIKDFLIFSALGAKYAIITKHFEHYQKLAENYLLDTKILCLIDSIDEIQEIAELGIDGVIFRRVLS